jgi:membrane protease subunit (stomatin/prohibitin family)
VATQNIAALDLAANYKAISEKSTAEMQPDFEGYGLKLTRFVIENISLPPEVEKMLDTRSQMGIVGNDMAKFTQFQTAQAITDAAKSGGGAGDMMGLGAGIAMGQQMASSMTAAGAATQQSQAPAAEQTATDSKFCSECGKPMPSGSKFCPECGVAQNASCPNCGKDTKSEDKFCKDCGHKLK